MKRIYKSYKTGKKGGQRYWTKQYTGLKRCPLCNRVWIREQDVACINCTAKYGLRRRVKRKGIFSKKKEKEKEEILEAIKEAERKGLRPHVTGSIIIGKRKR